GFAGEEALLEGQRDALREADADEAARRDGVAVVDQAHCLGSADDLVARRRVRTVGSMELHGVGMKSAGGRRARLCRAAAPMASRWCPKGQAPRPRVLDNNRVDPRI